MGFPDGYTDIPWHSGKGAKARVLADSVGEEFRPRVRPSSHPPKTARYKAIGNAWAINCARWVLRRLDRELHPSCGPPANPLQPLGILQGTSLSSHF